MKKVFFITLVLLFLSCSTIRVNYDYDKETDFSNYATYNYYADMETGLGELDTKRLLKAMDIVLRTKGLLFSEEPDFYIDIKSNSFQTTPNNSVGVGIGGTGRNVGGGVSIGIPVGGSNMERQIQFEFVDGKKNVLFWQAIGKSAFKEDISPTLREEKLHALVEKLFSKYPPKQKK